MKQLVIIVLVAVGGYLAWTNVPALRTAFNKQLDSARSWSAEDRRENPSGYIQFAVAQLEENIDKFQSAEGQIEEVRARNAEKLAEFAEKHQFAIDWSNGAKEAFRQAEENNSWPLTFRGKEYTRETFIDQVDRVLTDKSDAAARAAEYETLVNGAADQRKAIQMKVLDMRSAIAKLESQKAQIEAASLTENSEEILAQVNELVEGTRKPSATELSSLSELQAAATTAREAEDKANARDEGEAAALDFLNS